MISEHTLTEVPEEAMEEAISRTVSTLCEHDSRSGSQCKSDNSSDSESSDQMSEDNNYDDGDDDVVVVVVDDDASPHASVLKRGPDRYPFRGEEKKVDYCCQSVRSLNNPGFCS